MLNHSGRNEIHVKIYCILTNIEILQQCMVWYKQCKVKYARRI